MSQVITKVSWQEIALRIKTRLPKGGTFWGVPRGGAIVAGLSGRATTSIDEADYIIDDIRDSGKTADAYIAKYPGKYFHALYDRRMRVDAKLGWIQFPWEGSDPLADAETPIVRLLEFLGEDPTRDGLIETPKRVIKAWKEMTIGYQQDPSEILVKDFDGDGYDEMIVCRGVDFVSNCEHHMLPFVGTASVGYLPGKRVVGLSKMARLVDCFAKRLQVQERLTQQIAEAMMQHLKPRGVGVVITAKHACMSCRGVQKHNAEMVTASLLGNFRQQAIRSEFLDHCRGGSR